MSAASATTGTIAPFLVTPDEVLYSRNSKIVTIDATWFMPGSPRNAREEYQKRCLAGAQFLDLDEVASPNELGLKHMMPDANTFARTCEKFGIKRDSHVVLYDTHGVFSSPRALYMFRAFGHTNSSVLNGGLPAWDDYGGLLVDSSASRTVQESKYPVPELDTDVVKSYAQVVSNASLDLSSDPSASIVLDARSLGRFTGEDPEPRPGLSSGHIPHSFSLPFTTFLQTNTYTPDGQSENKTYTTFLPPDELLKVLTTAVGPANAQAIVEGRRSVIASCGSGMTAGVIWLALRILGAERVGIYDESWTGYASRQESVIIKGSSM